MATDVFSRQVTHSDSFVAEGVNMEFGASEGIRTGTLVQRFDLQYAQAVQRFWDLTDNSTFLVGGRAEGNANIANILGPVKIMPAFYKKFGDICQVKTNHLDFRLRSNRCSAGIATSAFKARYCFIERLSMGVASADMIVNSAIGIRLASFEYIN